MAEFIRVWSPYLDRIEKAGLKIAFYAVHGATFLNSLEAFERLWDQRPDIRIKFDPANWQHHGDDYLEVVRRYGHKIGYIHIKEHMSIGGQLVSQPAAGMGDIQWGKIFAFLYEHNYGGWLSVEPHGLTWGRSPLREKMLLLTRRHIGQFLI